MYQEIYVSIILILMDDVIPLCLTHYYWLIDITSVNNKQQHGNNISLLLKLVKINTTLAITSANK